LTSKTMQDELLVLLLVQWNLSQLNLE
jgi:hypothetical protein